MHFKPLATYTLLHIHVLQVHIVWYLTISFIKLYLFCEANLLVDSHSLFVEFADIFL